MEQWKQYKLGELITLNSGGTPDKSNKSYWGGDIPWISAKFMYDDYLYSSELKISQEGLDNGSRLAPKGSILLLTRGSGLFNHIPVCYVMKDLAYNQDVKCIESNNKELVSTKFLFYWLMGNKNSIGAILETTGIGAGKIDTNRLKDIRISLPPKEYQQALIGFAESIMHKIELNRRINDNLEQQAQALFKSWFVDFEPFKDGEFVDSELGMIPKGWRVVCLGEVTKQVTEKVGNREDVTVLSPVNSGELVLSEEYFTKQVFSKNLSKYLIVNPLSFAYNPARINIGSIGLNEYDFVGCVSPVYVVFKCEPNYHYFFDFYKRTAVFKDEVALRAIGGVRQSLGYDDFSLIKTIYPTPDVVAEFNNLYLKMKEVITRNDIQNNKLTTLRDSLLPKLMSGELKINNFNR